MHRLLILGAALLPALVLVYHIYRRDKFQPEPPQQLWKGARWGVLSAFISTFFATPFLPIVNSLGGQATVAGCVATSFLTAGVPEECAKALCLYLFLRKNPYFDEYMDGIVYAAAVGMGFAGFENILYLFQAEQWVTLGIMRAFLAVPAHFGFAVLMGYYFSLWRINGDKNCFYKMLFYPILAHGIYDTICFTMHFSEAVAVFLFIGLVAFMHYLRVNCSRLIARQLGRDELLMRESEDGYNRDEKYIGGCSDGRENV